MNDHIGDDLELYALGALEPDQRTVIDAHLATCADCSKRAGEAERVVAALAPAMFDEAPATATAPATVTPLKRPWFADRAATTGWLAAAAAIALAVGAGGYANVEKTKMATIISSDALIANTIVHSHFLHAAFTPAVGTAPAAKVLYARDGSWVLVVVDGAKPGLHVACNPPPGESQSAPVDLGATQARGGTSELFAYPPLRPGSLHLLDASGVVLASVTLPYPAR